jgi:hypothetical protein
MFPSFGDSFKSNQIAFSDSVFHVDSEYNIFNKFNRINLLEIRQFLTKKRVHKYKYHICSHSKFLKYFSAKKRSNQNKNYISMNRSSSSIKPYINEGEKRSTRIVAFLTS